MSSVSSDFIPPESVREHVRSLWEPALSDGTPWAGEPFKARVTRGLGPDGLRDLLGALSDSLFAVGDSRAVLLNGQEWKALRQAGRDVLDIEDDPAHYCAGLRARLWGAALICPKGGPWHRFAPKLWVPPGRILTVGLRDGRPVRHQINVEHRS